MASIHDPNWADPPVRVSAHEQRHLRAAHIPAARAALFPLRGSLAGAAACWPGVIGSELFVVYVAVKVTEWNAAFFNALEARNWDAVQSRAAGVPASSRWARSSPAWAQYWFGQTLIIRWREWMTQRYVALWMAEGRHYRIRFVDQTVDNIHLRIANDVLLFIQRTHELGTGLSQRHRGAAVVRLHAVGSVGDRAAAAVRRRFVVSRLPDRARARPMRRSARWSRT